MYYATIAAAALHQFILRSLLDAVTDDKVVAQNVASGLFCAAFVALGIWNRPTLLATSMLGYLVSDSASVTTTGYAVHHVVTAMLLLDRQPPRRPGRHHCAKRDVDRAGEEDVARPQ